ncbi:oligopeptidase A [Chromatocurvus halotolerans]|uniref:oligopeptidase A n=1 Tax=Chromatocurvus halotolerans TaxID=1132028 RepID=A0A4R2KQF8_9GAMM|nr:oligopeptidase A [Chromatocurvus halotolerans]TCO75953.1 oligopeptidase A [Chromatocurvus halotolerans]
MTNPLLAPAELPRFSAIEASHAEPAIRELIDRNKTAIEALLASHQPATWETVLQPIEALEDELARVWAPVSHLNAVVNSEELRAAYNACLPLLSAYNTWLGQHEGLFGAYREVFDSASFASLSPAQQRSVEIALRDFRLAGVALAPEKKRDYAELRQRLSRLGARFSENVLDATDAWSKAVTEKELSGLPASSLDSARDAAAARGKDGLLLTLDMPMYLAVMTYGDDSSLRREMYTAFATRASEQGPDADRWDNSAIIRETLDCRLALARLLGFDNYAELSLATKMARDVDEVVRFLTDMADRAKPRAKQEWQELADFAKARLGFEQLEAWDVAYCSEKLRQHRFAVSQEEIRPYLPVPRVLCGLFTLVNRLYGVEVVEIPEVDSYHPDVQLFEIRRDGAAVARFYLDLYARSGKRGGAWMGNYSTRRTLAGDGLQLPVAWLVCNFSAPSGGSPSLLTHDELTTLFHEFGHGLHHMLTAQTVASVSGINGVEWDAVELPSQFLENWCWEAEALGFISGHVETGEPLPAALLDKLLAARTFQAAMQTVRQLEFSLFDFRLHLEWGRQDFDSVQALLDAVREDVAVLQPPTWNRFQNSFSHIFAGGYAAGYYSYKWAEVLSADAYSRFEEEGIFNAATGADFLREVLEAGGSRDALATFRAFRGRDPDIRALLRHSGIAA